LIIEGIGNSWLTFFLKAERDPEEHSRVITAATHFVAISAWCALVGALFLPVFVRVALPAGYTAAEPVAIVVVLALMLTAPYLVWVYAVMSVEQITAFPLVTMIAAASNVILNLWLVPRIGVMAAAANTVAGYAVQGALTGLVASRVYPIRHEYGRWAGALFAPCAVGGLCLVVPHWPIGIELIWRCAMGMLVPGLFLAFGFLRPEEAATLRALVTQRGRLPSHGTGR
jgi:O-antigen/teichoic acid export membrane protein